MTSPETVPVLRVVSDIDNVKAATTAGLIAWSEQRFGRPFGWDIYTEELAKMWGTDPDETRSHWDDFCRDEMPHIPLIEGMQEAIDSYPTNVVEELLTSRGDHLAELTAWWARQNLPHATDVHHVGIDWQNDPLALTRTKAAKIDDCHGPFNIDVFKDDEPKHTRAVVAAGIPSVLFGEYPWNAYARQDEGTRWIPTASLWAEFVHEAASLKAIEKPIEGLFSPSKTILT